MLLRGQAQWCFFLLFKLEEKNSLMRRLYRVSRGNYVWWLAIVVIFMRFGQAGAKRCGGCLKVINWGWRKLQKGTLFIGKAGFHCVILQYCKTLLQVFLGIYWNWFYRIPLFTILLLFYVFQVGKAKSATQSVLIILTLNGLFQKIFRFFTLPLGNSRQNKAHPYRNST